LSYWSSSQRYSSGFNPLRLRLLECFTTSPAQVTVRSPTVGLQAMVTAIFTAQHLEEETTEAIAARSVAVLSTD
jgi:hypothetical protein